MRTVAALMFCFFAVAPQHSQNNQPTAKMGHDNNNKNAGTKGWKANSKDGNLLAKPLKQKKFSAGVAPAAIKESLPSVQSAQE